MLCCYCDKTNNQDGNCPDTNCPGSTWTKNPRLAYRVNFIGFEEEFDALWDALGANQWKLKFLGHDGGWLGEPRFIITTLGARSHKYKEPTVKNPQENKHAQLSQIIGLKKELMRIRSAVESQGWEIEFDSESEVVTCFSPETQKEPDLDKSS